MLCKKCGAEIPEGNKFCEMCGTPVDDAASTAKPATGKLGRKKLILIAVCVAVLFGCIGALTAYLTQHSDAKYQAKLDSAQKFLDDGKYDAAIETLESAIEIKPRKERAYLDLSNIYIVQENYYEAVTVLKRGYEATGNKEVFKEPIKEVQSDLDNSWKSAYTKVLEENRDLIKDYEKYRENGRSVAIMDLNGDEIPELIFFAAEDGYIAEEGPDYFDLYLYTFASGKAVRIDTNAHLLPWPELKDVETQDIKIGFDSHIIYCEKETGRIVIYRSDYADPGVISVLNEIDLTTPAKATESTWAVEYVDSLDPVSNQNDKTYKRLIVDGDKATEEEYSKIFSDMCNSMDREKVLFYNGAYMPSLGDREIWEAASENNPLAKSYDEAIAELRKSGSKEKGQLKRIDPSELPNQADLTAFLNRYEYYSSAENGHTDYDQNPKEYNCRHPLDYPMMDNMFSSLPPLNLDLYPGVNEDHWDDGTSDPRGWINREEEAGLHNYRKISEKKIDWIATNILNISSKDLKTIKKNAKEGKGKYYLEDGYYYHTIGGAGGPNSTIVYNDVRTDGEKYYIEYTEDWGYDDVSDNVYNIVMELKNIDGKDYWSIYYSGDKPGDDFDR